MKLHSRSARRTALGAVALAALATGVSVAPAFAAASAGTLSVGSGPSGGTNALTMTIPSTAAVKFASGLAVSFQPKALASTACSALYTAPPSTLVDGSQVNAVSPKVMSSTKIAFTVPTQVKLTGSNTTANWLLCVYPGTSTTASALSANAAYSIAAKPTINAMSASTPGIVPAAAPALGGTMVTVNGTNFITGLTAKLGSVALTNVSIASNGNSFTATVPAQAAATGLTVSVTTTGGTASRANAFDYTNGVIISPNTTPTATAATDVDIQGVGFSTLDFSTTDGTTPENTKAHVYVVDTAYDPADNSGVKTHAEKGECLNVLLISDNELICTVNTNKAFGVTTDSAIANGLYTLKVVSNGAIDADTTDTTNAAYDANFTETILSSGSTFTVAAY
jgi:IPT/TIG domain